MASKDSIRIWVSEEETRKAALPKLSREAVSRTVEVETDIVGENVRSFVAKFSKLLDDNTTKDSGFMNP